MKERLNANAVPVQLPIGAEDNFKGIVDLIKMRAFVHKDDLGKEIEEQDVPADMLEQVKKQHEEKTKNLMEGQYFEIVEKIFAPQKTGGIEVYTILLETYKTRYGESVYEMLQMYLRFILSI